MPRDTPEPSGWARIEPAEVPFWLHEAGALWNGCADPYLEQHPGFLLPWANGEGHAVAFYGLREAGLAAYAVFDIGPATLDLLVGELTLYRHPIRRMRLSNWAVARTGCGGPAELVALLVQAAESVPGAVIYLQGLPSDARTEALLLDPALRRRFVVLRYGRPRPHYLIDLPATADAFFAGLQKDVRGDLKRVARHLDGACGGDWGCVTYRRPDDVPAFLDAAMPLSALTFQYRLLHAGLSDRPKLEKQFALLAEADLWRGHLLRCQGRAVAFAIGYQLGTHYYFYDTGYDPSWARHSVGKILLVEIIKQLITEGTVHRFDFLFGDQDYKRRLANRCLVDGEYYLLPRTIPNLLLASSIAGTRWGAEQAGRMLDRWGLKARLRALLRRAAA